MDNKNEADNEQQKQQPDKGTMCVVCLVELAGSDEPVTDAKGPGKLAKLPNCGHFFHEKCLVNWKTHSCPVCRQPGTPLKN